MNQPLICMTLTGKTLEEDYHLVKKYDKHIDIVELRVDYLNENEQLYARRFPAMIPQPCILTIRRDVDGGQFGGGEFSRTSLFGRALAFADPDKRKNFAYVDFEDDYHVPSIQDAAMAFGVKIIRSFYSINEPVGNLKERCDSMRKTGYEIPKISFMPKTLADVTNLFKESLNMKDYDHILEALGPEGLPSKLLSPFTNSYITYVSPQEFLGNTNGLNNIDPLLLNELYNFRSISDSTNIFGITGWPLEKTSSPVLHNNAYRNLNMNAVYIPIRSNLVSEALGFAEQANIKGLSIAIPYKESVLYYLNEQTPEVIQIGACNSIVRKNNKWIGYNTDAFGFKQALEEFLGGMKLKRVKVAVLGAGGAAKAVVYILKQMGAKVCIFNRTWEHAQNLADKYGFNYCQLEPNCVETLDEYSTLIINTTSVGMNAEGVSNAETDPIYFYNFRGNELVFDLVYNPAITPLMKRASLAGCRNCNGYKMLEYQAYMQFKLFTGKDYKY